MEPKQQKSKGYWLFIRNGYSLKTGEGIRRKLGGIEMAIAERNYSDKELMLTQPWAIYKWIEPEEPSNAQ